MWGSIKSGDGPEAACGSATGVVEAPGPGHATHPDVLTAVAKYPRLIPVWLPTYSPWLNPIEKLWRWLRQDVLKMHRWVEDWPHVKQRVHDFLDQFAHGSPDLLRYVGLAGKGKLATVINSS